MFARRWSRFAADRSPHTDPASAVEFPSAALAKSRVHCFIIRNVSTVSSSELTSHSPGGLAGSVSRLAHRGLPAAEFYGRFLDFLPLPAGTLGTVAWVCGDDSFSKLAAGSQTHNQSVQLPVSAAEHAAQLQHVRTSKSTQIFEPPPQTDYQVFVENALPTIVVFPVVVGETVPVIVEAYLAPDVPAHETQSFIQQTEILCHIASNFHNSEATRSETADGAALGLSPRIHESLEIKKTCYAIVNEGRRATGCDRVTVLTRRGHQYTVQAVSGQESVNHRANLVQSLQRLVNRVMRTGDPFWYPENSHQLPPEIEHELEGYIEVSMTRRLGILPLQVTSTEAEEPHPSRRRKPPVGALVIEQFTDALDTDGAFRQRIDRLVSESSVALQNAVRHDGIFLLPLWRWLGNLREWFQGSALWKTSAALTGCLLTILALIFVPAELKVTSDGRLMPQVRRNLFAQFDGTVDKLSVEHGSRVAAGDVLATLRNHDLDLALQQTRGEIRTAQSRLDAIRARRFSFNENDAEVAELQAAAAEEREVEVLLESLQRKIEILTLRQSQLKVVSPIAGEVITWNLDERLRDRPVQTGQILLEVADLDGPWCLELNLPDRRVAEVLAAAQRSREPLHVSYLLASDTSQQFTGVVQEIAKATRVDPEKGQNVLVRVSVDKDDIPFLQPGTGIQAKIYCGQHRLGYVWLRDVWHFLQSKIVFRVT